MKIIEEKTLENGSHRNIISSGISNVPEGWLIIKDEDELPLTFPFVFITKNEDGTAHLEPDEDSYEKAKPEPVEPQPSLEERVTALEQNQGAGSADTVWTEMRQAIESGVNSVD